ncbi:kinase-like protein [Cucurbitaria berberidis CBS 394.84]|uniref:Kinase-like protein n=1 Tax=Cucurbitaria berberidis CBS 394.84 TaxID=1168544 RepID=A0A9P4L846_9PLEO|nr:kinase-like protein [Cucurbitaria berberidis CBS 394.84]KAF1844868.1 kinase-like protein [Cucurbitaria berberidis CBS 394.84]
MCTFGGCSQSYRTYSSRDDWQHHEDSVHRITAVWVCHDCNETLSSADSFQTHLRSTHQSLFPEKHLLAITKMCRTVRADEGPRQHCILCGANLTTKQDEYDHLATHLIDLALLVFPGADQPANDLDDSISEVFEQPRTIEGLEWFREFSNDDVIPFEYVRNLGHGAFAQVEARRCTIGPTAGTIYACKTFLIAQRNRGAMKQQIQAEVTILRRLQHVHIISIVGAYVQRRRIVLIQLPVFDFNLEQFLELVWDDEATLRGKWFGCLVSALAYLHAMRIRHKDVKPSNIGVKNGSVIMSDFSIATEFEEEGSDSTGRPDAYTGKYAPPEVLQYDVRSRSSDIFSLGCIFFEMLTAFGKEVTAFYKKDNSKLPAWYAKDTERLQETILHLKKLPVEIQPVAQICSSMVSLKRQARPSAQQVLDALMVYNLVGKCALSSSLVDFDAGDTASVHTVT